MEAYSDDPVLIKAPIGQQPYYSLLPISDASEVENLVKLRKKRRAKRFCHSFVATACLGYLVYLAAKHTGVLHGSLRCNNSVNEIGHLIDGMDYKIPKNVSLVHCVGADDWVETLVDSTGISDLSHGSEASFNLPLDSATLFLVSRGQNLGGVVNVVTDEDQEKDSAKVSISLRYHEDKARDWTKVCLLSRGEDGNGVGIFTPMWKGGRHSNRRFHRVNYYITVTLPSPTFDGSSLYIKHLETDLPNTAHRLEDLSDVEFDRISLRATNAPIDIESLSAQTSSIVTTNGHILGNLNSTLLSTLTATNGAIKVRVNVTSTEQSNGTFIAHTTNSPISAEIGLISTSGTGGTFYISTVTTNSPLSVVFPTSPVGSALHMEGQTTNSPAAVSLDTAYEGSFDLLTSRYFTPRLHYKYPVEDPAGKGRERKSHATGNRGEIHGVVFWDDEPTGNGTVIVTTTNSPVSLDL